MSKKVTFGVKPNQKSAEDWIASRETGVPQSSEPRNEVVYKRLTVDIPAELHASLKMQCAKEGVVMAEVIRDLLTQHLKGTQ